MKLFTLSKKKLDWYPWFAWLPVFVDGDWRDKSGTLVLFETVMRNDFGNSKYIRMKTWNTKNSIQENLDDVGGFL
jgi:hypothetical protein